LKPEGPEDAGRSKGARTEGVKTLLGDPRRAVIRLAIPMMVAMSVQTSYNFVDAIWVAGLGPDALAAVGFVFPFFFMATALSAGLGIGSGSAISRRIGAQDKAGADNVGVHTIVIMLLVSAILTVPFLVFARTMFVGIGAGRTVDLATSYARIIFAGIVIIFFNNIAGALLRGEGDARRSMYAIVLGAAANVVLDPIFIYSMGLGVAGAAWATIISMALTFALLSFWIFVRKDTYVSFRFRDFRPDRSITADILRVGIPASFIQLEMSFMMLVMNFVTVNVGGTDGVAIFAGGWRVVTLGTMPLMGISTAVVSISGASYGAREYLKLDTSYMYAIRMGLIIETSVAVVVFLFAPQITALFTMTEEAARIRDGFVVFLRTACIFFPGVAFGMFSSAMFQGIGRGIYALVLTTLRTLALTPVLAMVFAVALNRGLPGVWQGIVIGNLTGSAIGFAWGKTHINGLIRAARPGDAQR